MKSLFKNLRDANFKIDGQSSCFLVETVEFGGHQICSDGFTIGRDSLDKIRSFPLPKSSVEMCSFFDLINPYKRYIQRYQIVIQPLLELTIKKDTFNWTLEAKNAFYQLIVNLINAPYLGFLREGDSIRLETDVELNGYTGIIAFFIFY